MDFFSRIGSYLSKLYHSAIDRLNSDSEPQPASQAPAQPDQYRAVELREVEINRLIESSRPVRVGCYMEMHRVQNPEALREALRRATPRPAPTNAPNR